MRRSTDDARNPLDRVRSVDRQVTELSRAQGRASTGLRDGAGNALVMNADAPYPLLRPQGVDASVAFDPTTNEIKMVSPDTNEDRDMTVRDITSSGNGYFNNLRAIGDMQANTFSASGSMYANGDMFAVNFRATGQTTCNNLGANSANLGPLTAADTQLGKLTCNTIRATGDITLPGLTISTDPNGVMRSLNYYGGTFHGVFDNTSDPDVKHRRRKLDRSPLQAISDVTWDMWRYKPADDPEGPDVQADHVGPMADELAANKLLAASVRRDDAGKPVSYEMGTMLGILGAAVSEAAAKLDAASRAITGLRRQQETDRARLDALEAKVAALSGGAV